MIWELADAVCSPEFLQPGTHRYNGCTSTDTAGACCCRRVAASSPAPAAGVHQLLQARQRRIPLCVDVPVPLSTCLDARERAGTDCASLMCDSCNISVENWAVALQITRDDSQSAAVEAPHVQRELRIEQQLQACLRLGCRSLACMLGSKRQRSHARRNLPVEQVQLQMQRSMHAERSVQFSTNVNVIGSPVSSVMRPVGMPPRSSRSRTGHLKVSFCRQS